MKTTTHLLVVLLLSGCVAKGKHELLQVQLEATRTAMNARVAQQAEEARAMEARIAALEEELLLRKAELDLLRLREALSDDAFARAQAQVAQLVAEIERLRAEKEGAEPPAPVDLTVPDDDEVAAVLHARAATLSLAFEPVADRVTLRTEGSHLVVQVPLAQLVQEGWTTLSPRGEVLVKELATSLATLPGVPVRIEGHTDTVPRHSATFPSNWERGFGAALIMLRGLEAEGVPVQLSVASFAGTRPLPDVDPESDEQQRVELWIDLDPAAQLGFEGLPEDDGLDEG